MSEYQMTNSTKYQLGHFITKLIERYNPDPETNPDFRLFLEDEDEWRRQHPLDPVSASAGRSN